MHDEIKNWLEDFFDENSDYNDIAIGEILGRLKFLDKKTQLERLNKEIVKFSDFLNIRIPVYIL